MGIRCILRASGIEATATGLRLGPPAGRSLSIRTELVDLDLRANRIAGAYRPLGGGTRTLEIVIPIGKTAVSAKKNGLDVPVSPGATSVSMVIDVPTKGAESTFEVTLSP